MACHAVVDAAAVGFVVGHAEGEVGAGILGVDVLVHRGGQLLAKMIFLQCGDSRDEALWCCQFTKAIRIYGNNPNSL